MGNEILVAQENEEKIFTQIAEALWSLLAYQITMEVDKSKLGGRDYSLAYTLPNGEFTTDIYIYIYVVVSYYFEFIARNVYKKKELTSIAHELLGEIFRLNVEVLNTGENNGENNGEK